MHRGARQPRSTTEPDRRAFALVRHLVAFGPASRQELGRALEHSDATMSRLARSLIEQGVVGEQTDRAGARGRPRQILTAVPGARHVVGIKLTATTAHAVVCDLVGEVRASAEARLPRPRRGVVPVESTVALLAEQVARLRRSVGGLDGVTVSVGGVVAQRRVVHAGRFLGWVDVDLAGLLEPEVGVPVTVVNDVTALARQELWFGAGRRHSTFGLVTVGAGIGYAVVREGVVLEQLIDDGHLLAHAPVDAAGPSCVAGHRGCVSAYLDRAAVAARLPERAGGPTTLGEVVRDPRSADGPVLSQAARALGHLVATVAGALQTPRIVLAGEDVGPLYASPLVGRTLDERLAGAPGEGAAAELDVTTAPLGFSDWARGAAVTGVQAALGAL